MGRGVGTRQVLPLLEVTPSTPEKLLKLPFAEGSVLELRWDSKEATLLLKSPKLTPRGLTSVLSHRDLTTWLHNLDCALEAESGTTSFGRFSFTWHPGYLGPRLYAHGALGGLYLDAMASWDVLRGFLKEAQAEALF